MHALTSSLEYMVCVTQSARGVCMRETRDVFTPKTKKKPFGKYTVMGGRRWLVFSLRTWNAVFVVSDTDVMHEEKSNVEALASPYG